MGKQRPQDKELSQGQTARDSKRSDSQVPPGAQTCLFTGRDAEAGRGDEHPAGRPQRPLPETALPPPGPWALLTHAVALGVLKEAIHAARPCLAVEGALGVLAREARLAIVFAQLTLVHICHAEAGCQGSAGWGRGGGWQAPACTPHHDLDDDTATLTELLCSTRHCPKHSEMDLFTRRSRQA